MTTQYLEKSVNARLTKKDEIGKLQQEVREIEDDIKQRLIDERWTELLSVDWAKLNRVYK